MKLADLFVKLGLKNSEFNRGLKDSEKKTNAFGNGLKKIGGLIAGAFAVGQIVSFGKELLELGGVAEGVRAAFNRIADDRVLDDLKKATSGTVSELELMKRAVSAQNLGLPVENLAKLFEFATKRAQDTGESVDYLVNSIVTGIGRKSPLILDNLGISAIQLREKLKGVGMETASVADVAKAVGEIAADSMRESGGVIDTNAIKVQNLKAQWEDFKLALAEDKDVQSFMGALLEEAREFLNLVTKFQTTEQVEKENAARKKAAKEAAEYTQALIEINNLYGRSINDLTQQEIDAALKSSKISNEAFERRRKNGKLISELKAETEALKDSLDSYGINQTAEIQNTLRQIEANEELIKQLTTLQKYHGKTDVPSLMTGISETPQIGEQFVNDDALGNMGAFYDKLSDQLKRFTGDYLTDWRELGEALDNLIKDEIISAAEGLEQTMSDIFSGNFEIEQFTSNIIGKIGKFLAMFGKMLIAYGIAQLAFWESFAKGPLGAPLAIAAGVALVAIGGAIQGVGSRVAGGNLSTSSANTASFNVITTDQRDRQLVAKVTGNQLAFVLGKYNSDLSKI